MAKSRNWSRGRGKSSAKSNASESNTQESKVLDGAEMEAAIRAGGGFEQAFSSSEGSMGSKTTSEFQSSGRIEGGMATSNQDSYSYTEQSRTTLEDGTVVTETYQSRSQTEAERVSEINSAKEGFSDSGLNSKSTQAGIGDTVTSSYTEQSRTTLEDGTVVTETYQSRSQTESERNESEASGVAVTNSIAYEISAHAEESALISNALTEAVAESETLDQVKESLSSKLSGAALDSALNIVDQQTNNGTSMGVEETEVSSGRITSVKESLSSKLSGSALESALNIVDQQTNNGTSMGVEETEVSSGRITSVKESLSSKLSGAALDSALNIVDQQTNNGTSMGVEETGMSSGRITSVEELKQHLPAIADAMSTEDFSSALSPKTVERLETEGFDTQTLGSLLEQTDVILPAIEGKDQSDSADAKLNTEAFVIGAINDSWGENNGSYEDVANLMNDRFADLRSTLESSSANQLDDDHEAEVEAEAEMSAE